VVQGSLVERTARHGVVRGLRRVLPPGGGDELGAQYAHRVTNEGPDPAVSLHVYAPRLTTQRDYVADDGILRLLRTRAAGADGGPAASTCCSRLPEHDCTGSRPARPSTRWRRALWSSTSGRP